MPNSRRKGHQYERDIAQWYRERGFDVRRGHQSHQADEPDIVISGSNLWPECCHRADGNWIFKKMEQAIKDAEGTGRIPIVHAHKTRGEHLVVLRLEDWLTMLDKVRP